MKKSIYVSRNQITVRKGSFKMLSDNNLISIYVYFLMMKQKSPYGVFNDTDKEIISSMSNLFGMSRQTSKKLFNELIKGGILLRRVRTRTDSSVFYRLVSTEEMADILGLNEKGYTEYKIKCNLVEVSKECKNFTGTLAYIKSILATIEIRENLDNQEHVVKEKYKKLVSSRPVQCSHGGDSNPFKVRNKKVQRRLLNNEIKLKGVKAFYSNKDNATKTNDFHITLSGGGISKLLGLERTHSVRFSKKLDDMGLIKVTSNIKVAIEGVNTLGVALGYMGTKAFGRNSAFQYDTDNDVLYRQISNHIEIGEAFHSLVKGRYIDAI